MAAADDPIPQPFYHGTRADLKPGDLIEPGHTSNFGRRNKAAYVYLSSSLDTAAWGAELAVGDGSCRVYVVEPTGAIMADPNLVRDGGNPTNSYRSREPLRVTSEYMGWPRHPADLVDAMRERIERLALEPIDD